MIALLLALAISAEPAQSGIWVGVVDGKVLAAGNYRFVFIPNDTNSPVSVTSITIGENVILPQPQPQPTTPDLYNKLKEAIPTDKTATPALVAALKALESSELKQPKEVATAVNMFMLLITTGQPDWAEFNVLVKEALDKCTDITQSLDTLKIIIKALE